LVGDDEDITDPKNTVPGLPDELIEAVCGPEGSDGEDENS
jgi:hypothetical protein